MEVKKEDIPDNIVNMADIIGIDKLLEVSKLYGGEPLYIPVYKSMIRKARNREIVKKYNGYNERFLADTYGMSICHLLRILKADDYDG